MPLTEAALKELAAEYFADDVPIDVAVMSAWTEDQARTYFDSGGVTMPGAAAASKAASGVFALPPSKIITGKDLDMSSLAGKPVFIINVASR